MYDAFVTWTLLSANCRKNQRCGKRFESKSQQFVPCQSLACHVTEEELFVLSSIFHDNNSFSMRTLKNKEESALVFFHSMNKEEDKVQLMNKRRDIYRNSLTQQSRTWGKGEREEQRTGGIAQMSSNSNQNNRAQSSKQEPRMGE